MDTERVELVESRPAEWAQRFQRLGRELRELVGADVSIEHIGSTAVPDLPSKDVVDILVGVAPGSVPSVRNSLVQGGFILDGQCDGHAWLTRRKSGRRVCVIHVVENDSERWARRIAFRDLLRKDADARAEYLRTKRAAEAETSNWATRSHRPRPSEAIVTDSGITLGPKWADSHQGLSQRIREVLEPPARILQFWIGPPELPLIRRNELREKLLALLAMRGLEPVLLFSSRRFTRRVVAWGRHARDLLKEDLKTAGDTYWWAYDIFFATPSQDLELILLEHPDGTDFGIAAWGVGAEELLQDALALLHQPGA